MLQEIAVDLPENAAHPEIEFRVGELVGKEIDRCLRMVGLHLRDYTFLVGNCLVILRLRKLPVTDRYAFRTKPLAAVVASNTAASRQIDPGIYVDILAMISDADGRVPVFTPTRKFISQDRRHLTKHGASYIGSIIFQHRALSEITKSGREEVSR